MLDSNEPQKIRVVGYCRGNSNSIENQMKSIREYVDNSDDMELLDIYAEYKCSGLNPNRACYLQMLDIIQNHKADMVVCTDMARFFRHPIGMSGFLQTLQQAGASCMFLNNPDMTMTEYMGLFDPVLIQGGESYAEGRI